MFTHVFIQKILNECRIKRKMQRNKAVNTLLYDLFSDKYLKQNAN